MIALMIAAVNLYPYINSSTLEDRAAAYRLLKLGHNSDLPV